MKLPIVVLLSAMLTLTACGGGGNDLPPVFTTQILSDATYDGDIALASGATYTVRQGNTQSVFAGIDPATSVEYRAFLDFPLGGPGGVPLNAGIFSAALDIVITNINPNSLTTSIPIRIELVSHPPDLLGTDFDRTIQPALAFLTIQPPISQSDVGNHVTVNVTALMREAQRLGLLDFQVRIMKDLGPVTPGIIEINDTTGQFRAAEAPLLQVSYF